MRTMFANYVDHAWQLVFTAIHAGGLIGSVTTGSSSASGIKICGKTLASFPFWFHVGFK